MTCWLGRGDPGTSRIDRERATFIGVLPFNQERCGMADEVEAMISKDLEYLTEEYVPMKLKNKKMWLG